MCKKKKIQTNQGIEKKTQERKRINRTNVVGFWKQSFQKPEPNGVVENGCFGFIKTLSNNHFFSVSIAKPKQTKIEADF